jgi:hypothetical protein
VAKTPEWRLVYTKLLSGADFGDVITYEALDLCLGRPFIRNRGPVYRACQELGAMRFRWLEAIPGVGYRVIAANEHVRASGDRKMRARRQLDKMMVIARATDLAVLTDDERDLWDRQNRVNVALVGIVSAHEQRINRIEEILRADGKL